MARPLNIIVSSLAALGAVAIGAYLVLPSDPVTRLTIDAPGDHWQAEGFVEMVPPIHLPSSAAGVEDVVVWLSIPDDGVIETRWSEDRQGWVLAFPPGSIADRVEQRGAGDGRAVVDVRGVRLDASGAEWMHTYRRAGTGADVALFGYEWPRADPEAHLRATDQLIAELEALPPATKMQAERRDQYLARIRKKNDCVDCHVHERPDNTVENEYGLVNRGTDANGWFTPQTVLLDAIPIERYGGVDPNLDDPAVSFFCPGEKDGPERRTSGDRTRLVCLHGAVPVGKIDFSKVDPGRLARICRARTYLHAHLDAKGREVFAAALEPCAGLTSDDS